MARMSIDDSVQRDPRITKLAKLVGWSRRETVGCLVSDVWPITYDQRCAIISSDLVDLAAGVDGFAQHMVTAELARWVRGNQKVRISGAEERLKYLADKSTAGRVGGLKSAETRQKNSSSTGASAQAERNPPVPDPVLVPSPVPDPVQEKNSAAPAAGGPVLDLFNADRPARKTRARKPKPIATPGERDIALRVLAKLGQRNGVRYSGCDDDVGLIVNHLRRGVTEFDLRGIIAYCADELEWVDDPKQSHYLRPSTLFGPKTIAKYLDPARTYVAKHNLTIQQPTEAA